MSCNPVKTSRLFGGRYCFHLPFRRTGQRRKISMKQAVINTKIQTPWLWVRKQLFVPRASCYVLFLYKCSIVSRKLRWMSKLWTFAEYTETEMITPNYISKRCGTGEASRIFCTRRKFFYYPLFDRSETHVNKFILKFIPLGILLTEVFIRGQKLNSNFTVLINLQELLSLIWKFIIGHRSRLQQTEVLQTQIIIILQHSYCTEQLKHKIARIS